MEAVETIHEPLGLTAILIAAFPLIAFIFLMFFSKTTGRKFSGLFSTLFTFISACVSLYIVIQIFTTNQNIEVVFQWFEIKGHSYNIRLFIDQTAALMLVTVCFVSTLVQLFSQEYMKEDEAYSRYFAFLSLFTFSMLGIILTSNLLIIYIFWELVGLSSYLLIGFWHQKKSAQRASKKAFLLNRIGDAGFLCGLLSLFVLFSTSDLQLIAQSFQTGNISAEHSTILFIAGFGIFCGAVGKSAQLPLSSWLPDAMEGPTPVSALIHAATMVAAGVYMLFRTSFLFTPEVNLIIAFTGIITAFAAAFTALTQTDIKKVLAFSTISQLGYMVSAIGVGATESAMFHLFTHAFFKAGLFLAAGAVIHALHHAAHASHQDFDAQDMNLMGGLYKKLPFTAITFTLCGFALAGIPLFSGFLSKDAILTGMLHFSLQKQNSLLFIIPFLGFLTAVITSFYTGRQLIKVFGGKDGWKGNTQVWKHIQENTFKIKLPLALLAGMSLFLIFTLNPFNAESSWLMHILGAMHSESENHLLVVAISTILSLSGIGVAWLVYQKESINISRLFSTENVFYKLSYNFWYLDKLFDPELKNILIKTASTLAYFDKKWIDKTIDNFAITQVVIAHVIAWIDRIIIDGFVKTLVWLTGKTGNFSRKIQGGKVQSYISAALVTTLLIALFFIFKF
ncbi:NADH-quinone oxidoreductase subunit L [Chondrinema litorale]|uniref:NADH-quinone oxidoreductase subunit L n=1 Tax=Chondrinema litorale TaxID=2994555 RepID=UPI002542A8CF|nr:NADH-quinone oxidoreductase subunit L [Chondrinema litorale]UZR95609.1 NADH-quinone oxidoreductase subunit L [Chondrinema litorale]